MIPEIRQVEQDRIGLVFRNRPCDHLSNFTIGFPVTTVKQDLGDPFAGYRLVYSGVSGGHRYEGRCVCAGQETPVILSKGLGDVKTVLRSYASPVLGGVALTSMLT